MPIDPIGAVGAGSVNSFYAGTARNTAEIEAARPVQRRAVQEEEETSARSPIQDPVAAANMAMPASEPGKGLYVDRYA